MRTILVTALGLLLSTAALAGPSVPRKAMSDVPEAAAKKGQHIEDEAAAISARATEYAREAERHAGRLPTLKQEVKVVNAEIKAEKARKKAARKAKDKGAMSQIDAELKALDGKLEDAERLYELTGLRADVLAAHADLLEAEAEVKRAKAQQVYAEALLMVNPEFDPNKYLKYVAKAETKYQKAREQLAKAERKLVAGGGDLDDLARDQREE